MPAGRKLQRNHEIAAASPLAFQNHLAMTTSQPHSLRDGSHNHPSSTSPPKQAVSASRQEHDHDLRDGSHNHPAPNTLSAIEARLADLNLVLPPPGGPKANYQLVHRDGDLLYLSGHLPLKSDGTLITGACAPSHIIEAQQSPKWISTEQGYEAAQHCALNLLSTLQSYLLTNVMTTDPTSGVKHPADLSRVAKIVKLFGIVRSHEDFVEQHLVMNGASDVLNQALGKDVGGCHARSAIGTNSLPLGICVEVEMIAKIADM